MKAIKVIALSIGLTCVLGNVHAQVLREYMNDAKGIIGGKKKKNDNSITNTEIVAGLKEALDQGAKTATSRLSLKDGFFGNALVKVLMPPEAKKGGCPGLKLQFGISLTPAVDPDLRRDERGWTSGQSERLNDVIDTTRYKRQ